MRKAIFLAATAALLAVGTSAGATSWILNLDGVSNASANGANAVVQNFAAGSYKVSFTQGQYTAFSRWSSNTGCSAAGDTCRQGWENSVVIGLGSFDPAEAIYLGDADATGGYGPSGNAYFATPELAFANAQAVPYTVTFHLNAATDVGFVIADGPNRDNRGGVSVLVQAVPEPATWAMLVAGFGLVGLGARRRRALAEN